MVPLPRFAGHPGRSRRRVPLRHARSACFFLLALLAAGCSPYTIHRDWDPEVLFGGYKTFGLYAERRHDPQQGPPKHDLVRERVRRAISDTLKGRGLTYQAQNPQLMIAYDIGAEQRVRVDHDPGYGGYHWHRPYPTSRAYSYTAGTLVVMVVDRAKNRVIWEARGETAMSKTATPEESERKVREIVGEMFDDFPPEDD